jgi:hypothetical protein
MPQASRSVVAEVALVWGGGAGIGRALALSLGARGVGVVVAGTDERALARVVGEVTCGGGKARHVAGSRMDTATMSAAVEKAHDAFGDLTHVILVAPDRDESIQLVAALPSETARRPRALLIRLGATGSSVANEAARETDGHGCVDELLDLRSDDPDGDRVVDLALFLLSARPPAGASARRLLVA